MADEIIKERMIWEYRVILRNLAQREGTTSMEKEALGFADQEIAKGIKFIEDERK